MMDPQITLDKESVERNDLKAYLTKWLAFIETIKDSKTYEVENPNKQLSELLKAKDMLYGRPFQGEPDGAKLALARALSRHIFNRYSQYSDKASIHSLLKSYKEDFQGPSQAYLKLVLGKDYQEQNLDHNLHEFLTKHFHLLVKELQVPRNF